MLRPLAMRAVSPLMQRQLLRRSIDAVQGQNGLDYFAPIARTPGMLDLLVGFICELKRLEIWPDHFVAACRARGLLAKDRELHRLFVQVALREQQLVVFVQAVQLLIWPAFLA